MKKHMLKKWTAVLCAVMIGVCFVCPLFFPASALGDKKTSGDSWKDAPVITEIKQTGDGKVRLKWTANGKASQFEVYEYADGKYTSVKVVKDKRSVTLSSVKEGKHSYAVRARKKTDGKIKHGKTSQIAKITVTRTDAWKDAPKISGIRQTGEKEIRISWISTVQAEKYEVCEVVGGKLKKTVTVKGKTEATISGVKKGTHTYCVRPCSTRSGRTVRGTESESVEIQVVDAWKIISKLSGVQTEAKKVRLEWVPLKSADSYRIYEIVDGKQVLLKTVKSEKATLKGVKTGTHRFAVQPVKKANGEEKEGVLSSSCRVNVVSGWKTPVRISKPVQTAEGTVRLSWKGSGEKVWGYEVSETVNKKHTAITEVKDGLSAVISGLTPGTHYFTVRTIRMKNGKKEYGIYAPEKELFVKILSGAVIGNYTFSLTGDQQVCVTGYSGKESVLVVPEKVVEDRYKVVTIGEKAFSGNKTLKEITLPAGLTRIEKSAFADSGLTTVHLPDTIRHIEENAFDGSMLRTVQASRGTYGYQWGREKGLLTEYRALLIGERTFDYGPGVGTDIAERNVSSAKEMENMLKRVEGPLGNKYLVTRKTDLSYRQIKNAIQSTFADAMEQDVSLFYIATHGNSDGDGELLMPNPGGNTEGKMVLLPFSDLAAWLNQYVKGEVIVILESCGSGSAVYRSNAAALSADGNTTANGNNSFNGEKTVSQFIDAFRKKDSGVIRRNEGTPFQANSTGDLRQPKFYVLASARHGEESFGYEGPRESYNLFTKWLVEGIGKKGSSPADKSKDGILTLKELYNYVKSKDSVPIYVGYERYYQHVQCYPAGSVYPMFRFP